MEDISIDTSSLSILASSDVLTGEFIAVMREQPFRLVIPASVTDELHGGTRAEEVLKRAKLIGRLWSEIGDLKFSIARSSHLIQREELEHEIARTPTMSRLVRNAFQRFFVLIDEDQQVLKRVMKACEEIAEEKDLSLSVDKTAQSDVIAAGHLDTDEKRAEIGNSFRTFRGPEDDFQWYLVAFLSTDIMQAKHLIRPISEIRLSSRYKALRICMSLAWLTMYGGAMTALTKVEEVALFKVKENNWYDNVVTTSAAYSKFFIIDDGDARRKAEFLVRCGMAEFTPIRIRDFISKFAS